MDIDGENDSSMNGVPLNGVTTTTDDFDDPLQRFADEAFPHNQDFDDEGEEDFESADQSDDSGLFHKSALGRDFFEDDEELDLDDDESEGCADPKSPAKVDANGQSQGMKEGISDAPRIPFIDSDDEDNGQYIDDEADDEDAIEPVRLNQDLAAFQQGLNAANGFGNGGLPGIAGIGPGRPRRSSAEPTTSARGFAGPNGIRRKRRAIADLPFSPEVQMLLGQANNAYVLGRFDEVQQILTRVIHIDAYVYPAWKILGEAFAAKGEKVKCLLSYMTAAHIRPREHDLWVTCAQMTIELEPRGASEETRNETRIQAAYLYGKAIQAKPEEPEYFRQRAAVNIELQQWKMVQKDLEAVLKKFPHDRTTVKLLARCFVQKGEPDKAITIFQKHLAYWMEMRRLGHVEQGLGWDHLNIYAEILYKAQRYESGIQEINFLGRWLCGREEQSWWELYKDDREWDADEQRKMQAEQYKTRRPHHPNAYILPIDLHVRLGQFRLKVGDKDEGFRHLELLLSSDIREYGDLFIVAGEACAGVSDYARAVLFWKRLLELDAYNEPRVTLPLGRAYLITEEYNNALMCFESVIKDQPKNIDARVHMVEVLETLERRHEALEVVNDIIELRKMDQQNMLRMRIIAKGGQIPAHLLDEGQTEITSNLLVNEYRTVGKPRLRYQPSFSERQEAEKHRTDTCIKNYHKLKVLWPAMVEGETKAVREWMDTACEMVDDFRNSRALYPSERKFEYAGFVGYTTMRRTYVKHTDILRTMEKKRQHLQATIDYHADQQDEQEIGRKDPTVRLAAADKTQYRGVKFEVWLEIILTYAICLAKYDDPREAYTVCKSAKDANVFYHDKSNPDKDRRPVFLISAVHLACAIHARDPDQISDAVRWFTSARQFQNDAYALYTIVAIFAQKQLANIHLPEYFFNAGSNQKYLMRHIKLVDKHILKKDRIAGATATAKDDDGNLIIPTEMNIALLTLYGHTMCQASSHTSAIHYFARAQHALPNQPMVLFSLAKAYMERAMQRQSENRQFQLLQAFHLFFEYYRYRCGGGDTGLPEVHWLNRQEAEFNIGRAYHQVGLVHFAIPYYERVLALSDQNVEVVGEEEEELREMGDLRWEAAYNLQIIYLTSGNSQVAKEIVDRYMAI